MEPSARPADEEQLDLYCPYYAAATDVLSRRWAAVVLRSIRAGATRFRDISAAVPGMTDKLLSQRLKDLEAEGLIERLVHPTTPVRVEYRLTDKGASLSEVLLELNRWALEWIDLPEDARPKSGGSSRGQ
ncbi:helix-turn-helix transcriptional regulator [Nocardia sp. CDC159]|uniref:Helix-turn-helix transcriptional regulator n=1 Tax=Nocardia pulmonis TaxID=2951408 RepID=A0A9X2IYG6_9NOCA|nr:MULTISPECIES: helix-turn-helix domain-containing protein [Nocardia]MCM6776378.1 helix-turn-helix transcriptional regulator [Nocardia pulmonis]MCM6788802.1 helix-turn-helix transcriptional regulator [Nocardia sp. CDC159]